MLTVLLILGFGMYGVSSKLSDYYSEDGTSANNNLDWMSRIPNSLPIRNLSIPGTHNSVSFYGGSFARCHTLPLLEQFKAGIRFLDIRCHHASDSLPIYHGIMFQQTNFDEVVNDTVQFLEDHQQEVVFMRIRQESAARELIESLTTAIQNHINMYPRNKLWTSVEWPTLREARGKIIILQNFDTHHHIWVPYSSMSIDDHWNVRGLTRTYLMPKWRHIKAHLRKSVHSLDPRLHLTYSSGASFMAFPYYVAKRMNKNLWKLFRNSKWRGRRALGIIGMDFPGDVLINQIINSNFNEDDGDL